MIYFGIRDNLLLINDIVYYILCSQLFTANKFVTLYQIILVSLFKIWHLSIHLWINRNLIIFTIKKHIY